MITCKFTNHMQMVCFKIDVLCCGLVLVSNEWHKLVLMNCSHPFKGKKFEHELVDRDHFVQVHRRGRHAGPGARSSAAKGKADPKKLSTMAHAHKGKQARLQASEQARSKSRKEALDRKRHTRAPIVVQMLCTSPEVDYQAMWCAYFNSSDSQ
jgi:hypothetical protein